MLDIGTGEIGLLAHYAFFRGADKVFACDKDSDAVENARSASSVSEKIYWSVCDGFKSMPIKISFDFVLSNPPQMPMESPGSLHDYGGHDGRDVIISLIKEAKNRLAPQGKLLILCFDFLGVIESFNSEKSLSDIATGNCLNCRVVASYRRSIRKGGKTEESLPWINFVYPGYTFKKDAEGNFYHDIFIVEFDLVE